MASNSGSCAATRSRQTADRERKQLRLRMETREETLKRWETRRNADRQRQRRRCNDVTYEAAVLDIDDLSDATISEHNCGSLSLKCRHCDAAFYIDERLSKSLKSNPAFGLCCGDGKVKLWSIPEPTELLATLLTDGSTRCHQFRRDIRKYNCALCLASLRANQITFANGPSVFKVQGEIG